MLKLATALARRASSTSSGRAARSLWEDVRDWIDVFGFWLRLVTSRVPRPRLLLYFGYAPGDDLLCTAVFRELRRRGRDGLLMISNHDELFAGNPDLTFVRPLWRRYYTDRSTVSICERYTRICGGEFKRPHYAPPESDDRSRPPSRHIIAELCAATGISGSVSIRPYFTLTEEEKTSAAWAKGLIAIQSSGMGGHHPIRNKQWYEERFQAVIDSLRGEVEFIQLGSAADPVFEHVKDLRGATGIRQAAAILYQARLYVGTVGFLMHLARAVECPSVIIYGGREAPWQSGYNCNFNIYSAVPCAPCWRWNFCEFDRKCMTDISVAMVVSAIRQMLSKPRGPLFTDTTQLDF
jgi:hypothetical protein